MIYRSNARRRTSAGDDGARWSPTPVADRFVRYVNRDNTTAASLKNQAIVVETTAYRSFEAFTDVVMRVVDARAQVSSIVGLERIGLRFVLEIRVPAVSTAGSRGATGSTSSCSGRSVSLPAAWS